MKESLPNRDHELGRQKLQTLSQLGPQLELGVDLVLLPQPIIHLPHQCLPEVEVASFHINGRKHLQETILGCQFKVKKES